MTMQIQTSTNNYGSAVITFPEMAEFIQVYNRLDQPQKEKLNNYWQETTHTSDITPQLVANLTSKDYHSLLSYARLLLITYCKPLSHPQK